MEVTTMNAIAAMRDDLGLPEDKAGRLFQVLYDAFSYKFRESGIVRLATEVACEAAKKAIEDAPIIRRQQGDIQTLKRDVHELKSDSAANRENILALLNHHGITPPGST